jgi:hypothetical protein
MDITASEENWREGRLQGLKMQQKGTPKNSKVCKH